MRTVYMFLFVVLFLPLVTAESTVLPLKKLVKSHKITPQHFHELNAGHLIYNYYTSRAGEKGHLTNYHNLQYTGVIAFGSPGQELTVIIDTGLADTMIFSKSHCTFPLRLFSYVCWTHKGFDESLSFRDGSASFVWADAMFPSFHLTYGKSKMLGFLMFDKMQIGKLEIPHSLLGLIEHWENSYSYSRADGVVGIGPRKLSNFALGNCLSHITPEDRTRVSQHKTLVESLKDKGMSTIGFHLYRDKKLNEIGQLVIGSAEKDTKRFKGSIAWFSQSKFNSFFWRLPLTKLKFVDMADGSMSEITLSGSYPIPDPGTSVLAGPPEVIEKINNQIFKGMKRPKIQKKYGTIEFDCNYMDQLPMVVFVIDQKGYILEPKDYVKKFGYTCTSGFMALEKLGMLVVGDTFFRKFYLVFDNENVQVGIAESIPPKKI